MINCTRKVLLIVCSVLTIAAVQVAHADTEDKSEEVVADQEINKTSLQHHHHHQQNESLVEAGPPDSHEAMNNREINPVRTREKRSYEFLMGLVNNNSKYEVTRIDPSEKPQQQQRQGSGTSQEVGVSKVSASELLLELMVKIAAHPDHWDKVHKLLQKIDSDLLASKKLVEDLQSAHVTTESGLPINKKAESSSRNKTDTGKNPWPTFDDEPSKQATFVNTVPTENYRWQNNVPHKSIYPKTFAYHRVTGRPLYLNKNPKAYIAVSVIAPKAISTRSEGEDLGLEKELRQLKPWTHQQNLQNMASIRSRWVIQSEDADKNKAAP